MWFQNRRAKWRKKENTKKGPGRPAHNAHPQTCSGDPIPPEELERREKDRQERKRRKQEERMRKLEAKRKGGDLNATLSDDDDDDEIDVVGEGSDHSMCSSGLSSSCGGNSDHDVSSASAHRIDREVNRSDRHGEADSAPGPGGEGATSGSCRQGAPHEQLPNTTKSPFSIDCLLEAPKVPRGRRPNSKYPRVQASKSMSPFSLGMMPLFPITQPVGFQVERLPTPPCTPPHTHSPEPEPRHALAVPTRCAHAQSTAAAAAAPGVLDRDNSSMNARVKSSMDSNGKSSIGAAEAMLARRTDDTNSKARDTPCDMSRDLSRDIREQTTPVTNSYH